MVEINLHGVLGQKFGKQWQLDVQSVAEAFRAIDVLTHRQFIKFLKDKEQYIPFYSVFVNEEGVTIDNESSETNETKVMNSGLNLKTDQLQKIDMVPIIYGYGNSGIGALIGAAALGAVTFGLGAVGAFAALGPTIGGLVQTALVVTAINLAVAGAINLLSSPPEFDAEFDDQAGRRSFFFNGPANTVGEGGPVPLVYGQAFVGSHVISESSRIEYFDAEKVDTEPAPDEVLEQENRDFTTE